MNSKKFAFRAIATLLCLVMLIGMIPVYVAADSDYVVEAGTVTLDTTTTEAVDGYYTVNVPINVTTNTGLIWIDFDVNYDTKLDLVDWTEGEVFPFDQDDMDEGIVDYEMSANNMT
ncbi:MAG: hypothetical protein IJD67_04140, partial [Clostridia bacterium]|nr:hypothetical protein [Clostridia bacterium]